MLFRVCVALILSVPILGHSQTPNRLDRDDVLFEFQGVPIESSHLGTNIAKITTPSSSRLCGFAIRGNHRSRVNPHVEWDLNIDQIVTAAGTAAGVSAGTFTVAEHKRTPRPAIRRLSFTLADVASPLVAQIRGAPNADNGIVALLESEPARQLFAEFQTERPIVISLQYADDSADQLEVRGYRDRREFGGGKNSYFNQCLRGFKSTVAGETITTEH